MALSSCGGRCSRRKPLVDKRAPGSPPWWPWSRAWSTGRLEHCLPVEPCGRPAIDAVSGQNIDSLSLWDSFLTNGSSGLGCNLVVIYQGDGDPCHQEDRKISSKAQVECCQERRRQIRAGSKKKAPVPQETKGAGACAEVIPHEAPLIWRFILFAIKV